MYDTEDAFKMYVYYLALKRHFTSDSYDFFKYNGKVRADRKSFETRKDKYHFFKLSKKENAKELILSNMLVDPNIWVGKLFDEKSVKIYTEWKKRKDSLTHTFKSEISNLDDDFNRNFLVEGGDYPFVLKIYNRGKISLETLIILIDVSGCLSYWKQKLSDNVLFSPINNKVERYRGFFEYDIDKMKKILLDKYNEK